MGVGRVLYESDSLRIQHFRHGHERNADLAFVFSSLGNTVLNENLYGGDFLIENGFDIVSFASTQNDWFQSVPDTVFREIEGLHQDFRYGRRVALGSSMGGYAAVCFSRLLQCDAVLAYSPQLQITDWFDGRFEAIGRTIDWRHRISADAIAPSCRYCFVYDSKDHDKVHVEGLKELIPAQNVTEIALPYAGHAIVFYLLELGQLKRVTLSALSGQSIDIRALRKERRKSRQYLSTLSQQLKRKGHHRLASEVDHLLGRVYAPPASTRRLIDARVPLLAQLATWLEVRRLARMGFDSDFYRHIHFDVALSGVDPVRHYVQSGYAENRLMRFRKP